MLAQVLLSEDVVDRGDRPARRHENAVSPAAERPGAERALDPARRGPLGRTARSPRSWRARRCRPPSRSSPWSTFRTSRRSRSIGAEGPYGGLDSESARCPRGGRRNCASASTDAAERARVWRLSRNRSGRSASWTANTVRPADEHGPEPDDLGDRAADPVFGSVVQQRVAVQGGDEGTDRDLRIPVPAHEDPRWRRAVEVGRPDHRHRLRERLVPDEDRTDGAATEQLRRAAPKADRGIVGEPGNAPGELGDRGRPLERRGESWRRPSPSHPFDGYFPRRRGPETPSASRSPLISYSDPEVRRPPRVGTVG